MDENISRAAGASHGQEADDSMFGAIVEPLGRPSSSAPRCTGARRPSAADCVRRTISSTPSWTPGGIPTRRRRGRHSGHAPVQDHGDCMTGAQLFDVVAIGNALVDVLADTTDEFLGAHDMVKGSMTLIDTDRAERLYAAMGPAIEISGGSAANTVAGVASLGSRAAYIGRVNDDQLGEVYTHDLRAAGVRFDALGTDGRVGDRSMR